MAKRPPRPLKSLTDAGVSPAACGFAQPPLRTTALLPAAAFLLLVGFVTLATHWPVLSADARNLDDAWYVFNNDLVSHPSVESARRFLSEVLEPSSIPGYYQPLSMISLMLDCIQGGSKENLRPFHRTSLALHVANTMLLSLLILLLFNPPSVILSEAKNLTRSPTQPSLSGDTGALQNARLGSATPLLLPALIAGILYGLHPATVTSIAWISERKTLLACLFTLLSLIAYVRHARRPSPLLLIASITAYALALMSKPTSTPLPLLLLILDYWPLGRLAIQGTGLRVQSSGSREDRGEAIGLSDKPKAPVPLSTFNFQLSTFPRAVLDKIPYFILGAASAWITYVSQDATAKMAELPTDRGVFQVVYILLYNVAFYFYKAVIPTDLSFNYPFPRPMDLSNLSVLAGVGGGILLIAAAIVSLRWSRVFFAGWLFFTVALLPTMGIIGFTNVIASDRYMYLPMIGLCFPVAYALARLSAARGFANPPIASSAPSRSRLPGETFPQAPRLSPNSARPFPRSALMLTCIVTFVSICFAAAEFTLTRQNLAAWQTSEALFTRMVQITPDAALMHNQLANALSDAGKSDAALHHYKKAVKLAPDAAELHSNLGLEYAVRGDFEKAIYHQRMAITFKPDFQPAHIALQAALQQQALRTGHAAAAPDLGPMPTDADGCYHRGIQLAQKNRLLEAIDAFQTAIRLNSNHAESHNALGLALDKLGRPTEALPEFEKALQLSPDSPDAHFNYANTLRSLNRADEAITHYERTISLQPAHAAALNNLAAVRMARGEFARAEAGLREAIRQDPQFGQAYVNLAQALSQQGREDDAVSVFTDAIARMPNDPRLYFARAHKLETLGRQDAAAEDYRTVLKLIPNHPDAQARLNAITQPDKH